MWGTVEKRVSLHDIIGLFMDFVNSNIVFSNLVFPMRFNFFTCQFFYFF